MHAQSKYQRVREFLLLDFATMGLLKYLEATDVNDSIQARFVQVFAAARTIGKFVVLQA